MKKYTLLTLLCLMLPAALSAGLHFGLPSAVRKKVKELDDKVEARRAGPVASGTRLWTRQMGTALRDELTGAVTDAAGNIYFAGYAQGALAGEINSGSADAFILKYDPAGNMLWAKMLGTAAADLARDIAVDSSGNVYVAGDTSGALDGEVNAGGSDAFLAKYDSSGNKQWVRLLGTAVLEYAYGVAVDAAGDIYIAGYTNGALDGQVSNGGEDAFIAKYNSAGARQWTRLLGTASIDRAFGVTVSGGGIYVTGETGGDLDGAGDGVHAGGADAFLAKYDAAGVRQWTRQLGTAAGEQGFGVAADSSGNIYVSGRTGGGLDGNTSAGADDLFLVKYDSSGVKQWTSQLGSTSWDVGFSVIAGAAGSIYVAGTTGGNFDGNTSAGGYDMILVKYDSSGVKQWTRQFGSSANDLAYGVAADLSSGYIYAAGVTEGGIDGNTNAGDGDIVLFKYTP